MLCCTSYSSLLIFRINQVKLPLYHIKCAIAYLALCNCFFRPQILLHSWCLPLWHCAELPWSVDPYPIWGNMQHQIWILSVLSDASLTDKTISLGTDRPPPAAFGRCLRRSKTITSVSCVNVLYARDEVITLRGVQCRTVWRHSVADETIKTSLHSAHKNVHVSKTKKCR